MELNTIGDFESIVDGLKPVTLSPAGGDPSSGVTSLRRAVTLKEAAKSGGRYTTSDTVFHVSTVDHPAMLPLGSQIVEADGTKWVVLERAHQTLLARWRYVTRLLEIVADAPTFDEDGEAVTGVFREVATFAKGVGGALEPTWTRDASPVVVRFDTVEESRKVENNLSHFPGRVIGYFENEIEVSDEVRFVDVGSRTVYKPVKAMGREKIGELFAVECEVTRWPLS